MSNQPPESVPEVEPAQVAESMQAGSVFILDVREDDEWAAGHIEGATHMPLSTLALDTLPADKPIVAVCRSGGRSGKAAEVIADAGLDVANMTGGMMAWASSQLPFVDENGNPGTVM